MIEGSPPQSIHNRGTQLRSRPLPTNRHTAQKHNASTGPTRKNGIPRSSSHPHFLDWTIHPFSLHCPWKRSRARIPRPPPTHLSPQPFLQRKLGGTAATAQYGQTACCAAIVSAGKHARQHLPITPLSSSNNTQTGYTAMQRRRNTQRGKG